MSSITPEVETREQGAVLPPYRQSLFIRAGAGAGKTTKMIQTFVDVAMSYKKDNGKWPRLVLTTFTRKATQDIKQKIIAKSLVQFQDPEMASEFFDYIHNQNLVSITTLDGLISRFVGKYASELKIGTPIQLLSEAQEYERDRSCLAQILQSKTEFASVLADWEFKEVLDLVRELYARRLERDDFRRWTAEADRQKLCERIECLRGETIDLISRALQIELTEASRVIFLNYQDLFKMADWDAQLLEMPSPRVPGKKKTCTENARIDEAIGALKELWKLLRLKSKLVDVYPTYEQTTNTIDLILEEFISKVWTQKIAGKGEGDSEFSRHEVCALAEEIIRKSDHARAHFSAQFDYWFIDEFQDTSPRQTQLLTEWIGSTPHFVVGDPQQSIYLFRGARPYVFHEKHREMLKQGAREFNLLRNYRSQPEIIHFVNDYFSERPGFSPMETRPNHDVNSQVLKQAQTPVQYWNMAVNSGDAIGEMEDHESEEGGDLQNDRRLIGAAIRAKSLQVLGARWSEIAVLTYTNSQSERVLQFLRDQGIPARLEGTADFFTTALAMELATVVRFMLVPNHNENFLALCRTPELGLSDQLLGDLMFEIRKKEFRSESHPESLFQFFVRCGQSAIAETKDSDELTPGPMAVPISVPERSLQVILETFSMAKSAGVIHALWNWIHQLGILSREAGQARSGDFEAQIWKFFGLLEEALSTETSTILEFLDSMSALETDHMVMPARVQDAVTVMTVHKSKGLEFPHVILPFFDHRFRSVSRKYEIHESNNAWSIGVMVPGDDKRTHVFLSECDKVANTKMAKEEALRLIYVAFTRAEDSLTLVVRGPPSKDMRLRSQIDQADPQSVTEGLHNGVLFLQNGEQIKDLLTENLVDRGNGENELGDCSMGRLDFQESKMSQWRLKTNVPDSGSLPPSQIHQEKASQAILNRSSVLESFQRAERGIQIHRLFESIRHSGFRKIQEGASALERRLLEYIRGCDVIPLLRAAEKGWVEWPYEYRTQAADVSRGQIDLFWIENEILYIVDYKTGSSHFRDSAFAQMREYARALQTIFPLHPIFKNHRIEKAFLCAVYPFEESTFIQEFMEWKKS